MALPLKTGPQLPQFNLEQLHKGIRNPLPLPHGGIGSLVLAIALWCAFIAMTLPGIPKPRLLHPGGSEGGAVGVSIFEQQNRRIEQAIAEMERKKAERERLEKAGKEEEKAKPVELGAVPEGHVRVVVVQFHPKFADPELNRQRLTPYIQRAALEGAGIVVLPEASVPGYAEMNEEIAWASSPRDDEYEYIKVQPYAESRNGPSVRYFSHLAAKHSLYITVPIIEQDGKDFYSTVVLVDPKGHAVLHYRKRQLSRDWDASWATPGKEKAAVVDTPYGKVGLLIGYDLPKAYPELVEAKADIILWSAAFRIKEGENFEQSLDRTVRLHVKKSGVNLALANWVWAGAWWEGSGYSRIIASNGSMSLASKNDREMLVVRDLKVGK